MKLTEIQVKCIIAVAAGLLFIPFLGYVHLFDWDEINFAECAREMLVTHDYFTVRINFLPFWEKPPLFIWFSAACMNLFGVSDFSARLPDAVCGIITLLTIYAIGSKLQDRKFGILWVLCFAASILPQFYFKSGIIDPWFNYFIFSGIYFFILFCNRDLSANKKGLNYLVLSALFTGLGVLTKGPVALLIVGLCLLVYLLIRRFRNVISPGQLVLYTVGVVIVGGLWFAILFISGNSFVIKEFFNYQVRLFNTQDSGHGGPVYYHLVVLLFGCFPASVFAITGFRKCRTDTPFQRLFKLWMLILFWVVLVLFSIVKTKIIHYSSLCYFPLTFLSAYGISRMRSGVYAWNKGLGIMLLVCGLLVAALFISFPIAEVYKQQLINSGLIQDTFALENLKTTLAMSPLEWLPGPLLLVAVIYCFIQCSHKKYFRGISTLLVVNMVVVELASLIFAPRIEQYVQQAPVEFYQKMKDADCYLETINFKSYAPGFYGKKKPSENIHSQSIEWLMDGPIDKNAYFVSKITEKETILKGHPLLKVLYVKNGFVFYYRKPA